MVKQLLNAGANLGHGDTAGQCPLVHAARNGHLSVVSCLLACDWVVSEPEDVELREAAQQALIAASSQGHTNVCIKFFAYSSCLAASFFFFDLILCVFIA